MSILLTAPDANEYDTYLKKFETWVKNVESSSAESSAALVEFTKLNWARTQRIHKTITLSPGLKMAAEKIQQTYIWMVLTEAWCGDSAQILPVIAEIAKLNPEKIKLYVLLRDENPELMNNYLTNGASAIPKLVIVNEKSGKEVLVWGPRPSEAQELLQNWKTNPAGRSWDDFEKELHSWYAKDKTHSIQSEFIKLLDKML